MQFIFLNSWHQLATAGSSAKTKMSTKLFRYTSKMRFHPLLIAPWAFWTHLFWRKGVAASTTLGYPVHVVYSLK